ncbi:MAG: AAA family ATPase [Lachnospiraceae bacterium]|jgi:hypothetical protein|nr:AAA family ATPase [Lachnospiraceae bacterium]
MIHFDEIKDKVIEYLKSYTKSTAETNRLYVIRDVYGRISIFIIGTVNLEKLKNDLTKITGENWIGQIRSISENHILYEEVSKNVEKIEYNIYYGERPLVKKNWNYTFNDKIKENAKIITFYSYKGGVGRTTALAMVALQMARKGKKVFAIDMDLEAPGLSTILRQETGIEYPQYGVVDFLVECEKETDPINMDEYVYSVTSKELLGMNGGELLVMQAANLSVDNYDNYYNKLSRIDFNMPKFYDQKNPIRYLFERINTQYQPDYILIDSRAGLHDIGGLTLFSCSHEVVMLFYGNEQNMIGLNYVLPKLCNGNIPFYLINTPVPVLEDAAREEVEYYIRNSFLALEKSGYFDELPDLYDESSVHYPLNIHYDVIATNINSDSRLLRLLTQNGDKNIYKQIADKLEKLQNENEYTITLTKNDRKTILQSIEGIIHSETPSAENEFISYESLKKYFYPLKEYKYIFDNSKFIITGSKGSGKTALFKVLNCDKYAKAMAEYIGIPTNETSNVTWLAGLDASDAFPDKSNFRAIGKTLNTEYYTIYWKILAVRTLKEIIKRYNINSYEYLKGIISCKYSYIIEYMKKYNNMDEELSELLSEINHCLEKDNQIVIITYDSLDFCIDKDFRGSLISQLIAFWAESTLRYKSLRAKIFLRNDIYKKEILLTDKIKLNNYRSNIEWTYDYLLAMLWKRMMEASFELKSLIKTTLEKEGYSLAESDLVGIMPKPMENINRIILNVLVGEKMGKGNKAYTYNWIVYRLGDTNNKIVPRSIIKLFSVAARHELDEMEGENKEGRKIFKPRSLENSIEEVSEDRITDMSEEYAEYQTIFSQLKNYCSTFPADEQTLYSALKKCGMKEENLKTVIDHFIEIGVLKEYQRKKGDAIRYHIPDIYLKGMKLKRKGYR